MKPGYFIEVFQGDDGKWYYRLAHINGNKLATSQDYANKGNAKRAARRVSSGLGIGFDAIKEPFGSRKQV